MYRDIWWQLQMLRTVIKETHCTFRCEVILLLYSVQPTAISRKECQTCHQYTDWWHVWFITQLCRDLVILYSHLFWLFTQLSVCSHYLMQQSKTMKSASQQYAITSLVCL
jgi:hypothetical protein